MPDKMRGSWKITLSTCALFALGPVTVDLSLPALPAIQGAIGTANMRAELSLTAVLFGMALGQFLIGAVADRYGRKTVIGVSLLLFTFSGLACALAPSIPLFVAFRFLQALGLGMASVMARLVVADVYDDRGMARVFSSAVMATAIATVLAPLIGGQVLSIQGWRAIPVIMAVLGAAVLLFVLASVPETRREDSHRAGGFGQVVTAYAGLLKNGTFFACSVIASCAAASQFAYNTGGPSVLIEHYGLSPSSCGLYMSIIALSMAVTSQINGWLLKWHEPRRILSVAVPAALVSALLIFVTAATGIGSVVGLVATLLLSIAAIGFILPNAMAAGLMSAGAHAGAASALLGILMFALGTIGSAVIGAAHDTSGRVMAVVIGLWALFAFMQLPRLRRSTARPPQTSHV